MRAFRLLLALVTGIATAALSAPAAATHNPDQHRRMEVLFQSPNSRINSDIAFWGAHAFVGYYRNDQSVGGFRIFDISDPARPHQLKDVACDGLQNDPIVWDRDGNGIADLLLLAVDRTMAGPACGAARVAHDSPTGWEGVRVFTLSDDPANPFATVQQVAAVYTDCGAHTITAFPDTERGRLLAYVSSYPLRPGPTCGPVRGPEAGETPLHEQISVVEVPLADPAASSVIAEPPVSYPGDPDGLFDTHARGFPEVFHDLVGCHDISVFVELRLAAAACAEQGQLWRIDAQGMPDTENPIWIVDDEVGGTPGAQIPGAVDFFHSATFSWDGTVVNFIDESFGDGCPPETTWPGVGTFRTGRMFFHDAATGALLSEFTLPRPEPDSYCSAHLGLPVAGTSRDLLVNAWYMGGVDVVDFTDPRRPREVAFYDFAPSGATGSDNWSAYPYTGPRLLREGVAIYATDGVHAPDTARGLLVFRASLGRARTALDHLNPQTQEAVIP